MPLEWGGVQRLGWQKLWREAKERPIVGSQILVGACQFKGRSGGERNLTFAKKKREGRKAERGDEDQVHVWEPTKKKGK